MPCVKGVCLDKGIGLPLDMFSNRAGYTSAYLVVGNDFAAQQWFLPGNHIEVTMRNIPKGWNINTEWANRIPDLYFTYDVVSCWSPCELACKFMSVYNGIKPSDQAACTAACEAEATTEEAECMAYRVRDRRQATAVGMCQLSSNWVCPFITEGVRDRLELINSRLCNGIEPLGKIGDEGVFSMYSIDNDVDGKCGSLECLGNNCDGHSNCTIVNGKGVCQCAQYYEPFGTTCRDADECAVNNGGCSSTERCENKEGEAPVCHPLPTCELDEGCGYAHACGPEGVCVPECTIKPCGDHMTCHASGVCVTDLNDVPNVYDGSCSVPKFKCDSDDASCDEMVTLEPRVTD
eukprot:TRINITY_DN11026_c0_g2_i1.p1 TRINITY_DN11026_c0_g2~~TRINITY_DN11026_c0_g2_i1.p1  ORF type:complete len:348 (+),score=79.15 TRINITY_DN11026_c0_g2_i1:502-1545(+)